MCRHITVLTSKSLELLDEPLFLMPERHRRARASGLGCTGLDGLPLHLHIDAGVPPCRG